MRAEVDPTAMIGPNVTLSDDVFIGPYCCVGYVDFQSARELTVRQVLEASWPETIVGRGSKLFPFSFVGVGTVLGTGVRVDSHGYVGSYTRLGDDVTIEYGARVYNSCDIGHGSTIGGFVCNECVIGMNSTVQGALVHARRYDGKEAAPRIGDDVLVGTNATVIGDCCVANGAYVAAGAVLTRSTLPGMLYAGVPAKLRGTAPAWSTRMRS